VPARAPLCCPGPNLRKTGRTHSSGVKGEFEGSPVGLPSPLHDGNWGFWALWGEPFLTLDLSRSAHRRYSSQMLEMMSVANSMTIVSSYRALDLRDERQGGDVSLSLRCSAAARHCCWDRRRRHRAGGLPKRQRFHRAKDPVRAPEVCRFLRCGMLVCIPPYSRVWVSLLTDHS
jgi:hypothetical protein